MANTIYGQHLMSSGEGRKVNRWVDIRMARSVDMQVDENVDGGKTADVQQKEYRAFMTFFGCFRR